MTKEKKVDWRIVGGLVLTAAAAGVAAYAISKKIDQNKKKDAKSKKNKKKK